MTATSRPTPSEPAIDHGPRLAAAIEKRTAVIGQVGLGTTGLPLAVAFADAGFRVVGVDTDPAAVDLANDKLAAARGSVAVSDYEALAEADCIILSLPTSWRDDGSPNLDILEKGWAKAATYVTPGNLIILESTVVPGTTRRLIEELTPPARSPGDGFFAAYSPERIDTGNPIHGLRNTPKLVAGVDMESRELAAQLYNTIVDSVLPVSRLEVAELAKVFENNFRYVNIALTSELADVCRKMGLDVFEVIEASASKPFAFLKHVPTAGVGGTCIPMAPHYFRAAAPEVNTAITQAAIRANEQRPIGVARRALEICAVQRSNFLLIGAGYKPSSTDIRGSVTPQVARVLLDAGAGVSFYDPLIDNLGIEGVRRLSGDSADELEPFDCFVVLQPVARPDLPSVAGSRPILDLTGTYDAGLDNVFRA